MPQDEQPMGRDGLGVAGLLPRRDVLWNLAPAVLVEHAIRRDEGQLVASGAFAATTGQHTGRSPKDRFVVREPLSEADIWWGEVNQPLAPAQFEALRARLLDALGGADVYVNDVYAGADPAYRLGVRVITSSAWHSLFARNMFLPAGAAGGPGFAPDWTVLHCPAVTADPAVHGTASGTFIVLDFARQVVLVGGTAYAGEIKKSIFAVMNHRLPPLDVFPMHCSANVGPDGDVALFFGLSGTGKTTLSADPHRLLVGDDEHGWGPEGVFNFEGGCYAKVIRLTEAAEPEIYRATQRFGSVIENVVLDPVTREADFDSQAITENTRASYPLAHLDRVQPGGQAGHPRNLIFLTADAFGVLPPIARLTRAQAMYHFLSGYTAKVAGTERGVQEPKATFSVCFGAPFLPRHPTVYAELLGRRMTEHDARVWLVNTGWSGGPHGVGERLRLSHTRAMVHAALDGRLDGVADRVDPVFGLAVPASVPGVPDAVLDPRGTWADAAAYDAKAAELAQMFQDNFERFADAVPDEVRQAGPAVPAPSR
jgi:phosphoenolpyruvate carboxykinase (ATP)